MIARNDSGGHLERSERSQSNEILRLKPQNDNKTKSSPLAGEEAVVCEAKRALQMQERGASNRDNKTLSRISKFTVFTKKFHPLPEVEGKCAFTLAEVLITLGIIGVVAAITLPSIVHNVQKVVLKNQFKRAYSNFYNAIKYVQVQNGAPYACFYWDKDPYGNITCSARNEYGSCIAWTLADGSPLPADINGKNTDCRKFTEDLMKTLKVVKFCENNALANGCITDNYRGVDKVKAEQNPEEEQDPNQIYSDAYLKQRNLTFVTSDGVLYSKFGSINSVPIFMVDVNGFKGPNKWGYDIFTFILTGDEANGITKIVPVNYVKEKGGTTINEMLSGK